MDLPAVINQHHTEVLQHLLPHTGQHWTYTVIHLHAYSWSLLPVTCRGAFWCGGLLKLVMAADLESTTEIQKLTLVVDVREHLLQVPPGLWKQETFYGVNAVRFAEITCRHNLFYLLSRHKIHLVLLLMMENPEFDGRAVASAARF